MRSRPIGIRANATVIVEDYAVIDGNKADSYGGGIYLGPDGRAVIRGHALLTNNVPDSCSCGGAFAYYYYGPGSGGGAGGTVLDLGGNAVIHGNTAVCGAGLAFCNSDSCGQENVTIRGNATISGNVASDHGSGLFRDGCYVRLMGRAEVGGSIAEAERGGFALGVDTIGSSSNTSNLIVSGNAKVTGNTSEAANGGGGVWAEDPACVVTAPAGSISGNTPNQCIGSSSADCTA